VKSMMRILGVVTVLGLLVSPAAASFSATFTNSGNAAPSYWTSVTIYETHYMPSGEATATGMSVFTTSDPVFGPSFNAFCVDITGHVSWGATNTYEVVDLATIPQPDNGADEPMDPAKAQRLGQFFSVNYASLFDGTADNIDREAFQLAVWEIVYEDSGTYDVSNGANKGEFYTNLAGNNAIATRANAMLNGVNYDTQTVTVSLAGLERVDGGQDFVTVVPVPAAAGLVAIGLGLVGWFKRRLA
jgi:hypothetical protein